LLIRGDFTEIAELGPSYLRLCSNPGQRIPKEVLATSLSGFNHGKLPFFVIKLSYDRQDSTNFPQDVSSSRILDMPPSVSRFFLGGNLRTPGQHRPVGGAKIKPRPHAHGTNRRLFEVDPVFLDTGLGDNT
jgi:hypothetical protein